MTPGNGLPQPQQGRHAALTPNRWVPSPAVRRWLYGIAAAVAALLIGYGVLTIDQAGLWLALAGAVLLGAPLLAGANTPSGS
jgi:predicted cobalt transporter CbtA